MAPNRSHSNNHTPPANPYNGHSRSHSGSGRTPAQFTAQLYQQFVQSRNAHLTPSSHSSAGLNPGQMNSSSASAPALQNARITFLPPVTPNTFQPAQSHTPSTVPETQHNNPATTTTSHDTTVLVSSSTHPPVVTDQEWRDGHPTVGMLKPMSEEKSKAFLEARFWEMKQEEKQVGGGN